MKPTLVSTLEAVLFFRGGSMTVKELATAVGVSANDVSAALLELKADLEGRGVRLIEESGRVALGTAPELKSVIETMRREELEGPIGKAGLETLAVILYRGPVSRAEIEYVRGVNVSSSLRTLLIRGLIERVDNPKDKRSFLYQATPELPAYLGVSSLGELPEYQSVKAELENVYAERPEEETTETETP